MQHQSSLQVLIESPADLPLGKRFNLKMRPLLDAVDKLRSTGVGDEGIRLPAIVVVGDLSSGKSSVLESLSGVDLPKGNGMVTRVPLILRLIGSPLTKITIAYKNKSTGEQIEKEIAEAEIADALLSATHALAGPGKGIAKDPITLNVSKLGAPDLTLVDLPGITRVPLQGQPDNIYEKIHDLIQSYIKPAETIILNVLSAAAMDFSVCESIRVSRQVDELGNRTLAVVTKVDRFPDGLLEKITNGLVKLGLRYICVRNRTSKEASFEEAARAERELFSTHTELKKLRKSMVGMEALANRLVELQTQSVAGVLPRVLKQIEHSMDKKWGELEQVGCEAIVSPRDATVAFFNVAFALKSSLQLILSGGGNIVASSSSKHNTTGNTSSNQPVLNYIATLHQEFEKFASMLTSKLTTTVGVPSRMQFDWVQMEQINQLVSDAFSTNLPNLVPQSTIQKMVSQLIDSIANSCTSELPSFVHDEACKVAFSVLAKHVSRFPHLRKLYTAAFHKALNRCKSKCSCRIAHQLDMEKDLVYTTCRGLYTSLVNKFQAGFQAGIQAGFGGYVTFEGMFNNILVPHNNKDKAEQQVASSVLAYWAILSRRLADHISHELRFSFNEALLNVADEVVGKVMGGNLSIEEVMAEQLEVENERQRLAGSLDILLQSKELISQVFEDACCV